MKRFIIHLIITAEGKETSLVIRENGIDFDFDISLIVADFMNSEQARGIRGRKKKGVYFTDDPFELFMIPDIEGCYYDDTKRALKIADQCKVLFGHKLKIALADFEEVKNRYKLELTYKVGLKNVEYNTYGDYESAISKWGDVQDYDHRAVYTCYSIADTIAAVFHYYLIAGYKLTFCQHCGREFATKSLKIKYCARMSPYKNIRSQKRDTTKDKNCSQMVHDVKHYIYDRKDGLKSKLCNLMRHSSRHLGVSNRNNQDLSIYNNFAERCMGFDQNIKMQPTPKNFAEYINFLKKTEEKKEWYLK